MSISFTFFKIIILIFFIKYLLTYFYFNIILYIYIYFHKILKKNMTNNIQSEIFNFFYFCGFIFNNIYKILYKK